MRKAGKYLLMGALSMIVLLLGYCAFKPQYIAIKIIAKDFPGGTVGLARGGRITLPAGNSSAWHRFRFKGDDHFEIKCPTSESSGYFTSGVDNTSEVQIEGCHIISLKSLSSN
jgi:hypothetical protein